MDACTDCVKKFGLKSTGFCGSWGAEKCDFCGSMNAEWVTDRAVPEDKMKRSRVILLGDSIEEGNGNRFIVRHDSYNQPNYFEINGEEVTEAEYRAARHPRFP
jgi:hypothetical protein